MNMDAPRGPVILMNPSNRAPPFVVVGLTVAICILGFNYWNVSSSNRQHIQEITDLHDKYRGVILKKMSLEKRFEALTAQLNSHKLQLSNAFLQITNKESEIIHRDSDMKMKIDELAECSRKLKDLINTIPKLPEKTTAQPNKDTPRALTHGDDNKKEIDKIHSSKEDKKIVDSP